MSEETTYDVNREEGGRLMLRENMISCILEKPCGSKLCKAELRGMNKTKEGVKRYRSSHIQNAKDRGNARRPASVSNFQCYFVRWRTTRSHLTHLNKIRINIINQDTAQEKL
jgi:hypothetical protein